VRIGAMDDNLTPSRGRKGHSSTLLSTAATTHPLSSTSSSTLTSSLLLMPQRTPAHQPLRNGVCR
jgi:hypothetical protein